MVLVTLVAWQEPGLQTVLLVWRAALQPLLVKLLAAVAAGPVD